MDFASLATNFGVAVACLVALGFAVWKALMFVGSQIVQPVALRHIKFLDDLTVAVANQSQAVQSLAASRAKDVEGIERIMNRLDEMAKKQDERLERMFSRQDDMIEKVTEVHIEWTKASK